MSRAFHFLLNTREKLYKSGVWKTRRLHHPVISVGNLTLGGTGKTPLVIALAERFRNEGFRPVILSRGYRRSSKGLLIVSRGKGPIVKWEESGDEPFLIATRAAGAAVVVGADRYEAGKLAETENLGNLFILDDGFQHRGLFRNVDIVTIDPLEWADGEKLLPRGRWREPKSALSRAHAACVQERTGIPVPVVPIPSFQIATVVDGLYRGDERIDPASLHAKPVVAFAGIAKPRRFFDALENMGIEIQRRIQFRDHHAYSAEDIANISTPAENETWITTEKDAVRLDGAGVRNFMYLRISANIAEFDRLMDLIRSRFS